MPKVQPRDWITIGKREAVVCHISEDIPNQIEVVYLDYQKRAINDDVHWIEDHWEFVNPGVSG